VSANPGCSLQIAASLAGTDGTAPAVAHTAQVLDASIRGLPVTALTGG
jgi:glycolate oxidase iron-sulfur subunit